MADNEQAEGNAAEAAEVPAPKGKLKLMIAAAAVLLMVVVVATTWFLFFRHPGDEMHADAAPAKPPAFLEVPDMLVNLSGSPGERRYSSNSDRSALKPVVLILATLLATTSNCRSSVICRESPTRSMFSIGGSPLR